MSTHCISYLERFQNYRNDSLVCKFCLLPNFYSGDAHHANYGERCSNHHFRLFAHCIYQIETAFILFEIAGCFAHFWLLRNLYCGDDHHANYGLPSSNHHFRHCAHCIYHIYSVLKLFEIAVCFAHFGFYEISTTVMRTMLTMVNVVQIVNPDIAHIVYITLKAFWNYRNYCLFCPFWLLRNLYSGDAHHANYGERSSNHHFRNCAPFLYHIYSVLKLFEIGVCFAHLGFYEVSTPMMRTMATMIYIVQIIISDVEHTLYITFTAFWNFSKLQFVLHILAFTKFLLPWCAPW